MVVENGRKLRAEVDCRRRISETCRYEGPDAAGASAVAGATVSKVGRKTGTRGEPKCGEIGTFLLSHVLLVLLPWYAAI